MRLRSIILALLALVACGEKETEDPVDGPLYCAPTPFARTSDRAVYDDWNDRLLYSAVTSETGTFEQISLRSYGSADNGIKGPGRYELAGTTPADCGLCVFAFQDCEGRDCDKVLFADTGAVIIGESGDVGGRLAGQLINVIFKEIAFDDQKGEWLPVPGGAAMCGHGFTFDVPVTEKIPEPTCVADGTGSLLGDNVADFTLNDCNGNPHSLHSLCGDGAVRLMAIAGWCSACATLVPLAEDERNRQNARGLETWYIMGEADYDVAPTPAYCLEYADTHSVDPARILLDSGQYGWEVFFTNVNPYISDGTIALPWNAVLDRTNMQYVYNDPMGPGQLEQTISSLLTP